MTRTREPRADITLGPAEVIAITEATMQPVRVRDLKDQIGTSGPRPFLYCETCGEESSANAGDYFMARPDTVFKCCGEPMRLVTKQTPLR